MAKRTAKIVVRDGEYSLEVGVKVQAANGALTREELTHLIRSAANQIAGSLRGIPYINADAYSTRVTV